MVAPFPAAALIIELTGPKSIDFVVQVAGQTSAQEGQQRVGAGTCFDFFFFCFTPQLVCDHITTFSVVHPLRFGFVGRRLTAN